MPPSLRERLARLRGFVSRDESPRLADESRWYTEHTALLISTVKWALLGAAAGVCVGLGTRVFLWALDRSRLFPGRYHVLGGRLSALEGVRPEDLSIDKLVSRVAGGGIDEVVLAMNATLEGQTTAHYLAERLESFPIRLSQLAHGLPVGGELDYLDEGTLAQALRARRPIS